MFELGPFGVHIRSGGSWVKKDPTIVNWLRPMKLSVLG